jgi:hypothetical protein
MIEPPWMRYLGLARNFIQGGQFTDYLVAIEISGLMRTEVEQSNYYE